MAKSIINQKIEYTLILNEDEAKWLKGLMQNPIFDETPEEEPKEEAKMRKSIWDALVMDKF